MLGIGSTELIVILVLALLVLGPEKMVKYGRTVGKTVRKMRDMTTDLGKSLNEAVTEDEDSPESEGPDKDKKRVPRLKKITDDIQKALTIEPEKVSVGGSETSSDGAAPEESPTAPVQQAVSETSEDIAESLRKMRQEISEAMGNKGPSPVNAPSGDQDA